MKQRTKIILFIIIILVVLIGLAIGEALANKHDMHVKKWPGSLIIIFAYLMLFQKKKS
jgi:uncharacterized membrane protein YfcA